MANYGTKVIFAKNLSELLAAKGITQIELATKMNVAASTVSSWCTGEKMPRMDKVEWMARFFDVPTSSLIEPRSSTNHYNVIKVAGRDGSYTERRLSDQQFSALLAILDQMPDVPDDL